ncbi:MAG: hypothetical protein LBR22_05800 [Desulfovibrio sp.]|jgi:hypothetical protein|nr:hypothetical protein [Desulfovibrio sp.]
MTLYAFHHVIGAASGITGYRNLLILGPQAILGTFLDKDYNFSFYDSNGLEIAPIPENDVLSDLISKTIGKSSPFHDIFGYYANGCETETYIFPEEWDNRVVRKVIDGDISLVFPSTEDLAISIYCADREEDAEFLDKLWDDDIIDIDILYKLLQNLADERLGDRLERVKARIMKDLDMYVKYN